MKILDAVFLLILSAAMLFEWMAPRHGNPAFAEAANAITQAIDTALKDPATRTSDLGGKLGTQAFARHVAGLIA